MGAKDQPAADASMDDILASIRRVLTEEDAVSTSQATQPEPAVVPPPTDDVFLLDTSMMVSSGGIQAATPPAAAPPPPAPPPAAPASPASPDAELIAPSAASAAAGAMSELVRKLASDRSTQATRNGPTIEDLVREEIRPVLRSWLDQHLPPLVERLVRAEIERVVSRATDL